ncbi:MAG: peptide-methionine (R)-S-oxide reductase MsrB [Alphaproteobacteria bacterium]|nr:peptide-methionine (R)-S-oxide reductase MsrB [Alphaproteobacteria bacterium]MCD8571475.1 peptide-methionine (R)-S-oxide reductase MsrB [Alphaproteobacteria bacterium]
MDTSHLTEEQKYVMMGDGTEKPFQNKYWDNHDPGIYVDAITGEPLFSSTDKFDSGTGWPSFTKPIDDNFTTTKDDHKFGMSRTEVRSSSSGGHLGHVFDDGPADKGGKRYCINSASLRFVPVDQLTKEGYGQYLTLFVGHASK